MSDAPTETVAVVADADFGDRLRNLSRQVHVWVCASPANRRACEAVWAHEDGYEPGRGATLFQTRPGSPPAEIVIGVLALVDEHHPSWSALEVYGAAPTPALADALRGCGVTELRPVSNGFLAVRPLMPA